MGPEGEKGGFGMHKHHLLVGLLALLALSLCFGFACADSGDTYTLHVQGTYDYSAAQEVLTYVNALRNGGTGTDGSTIQVSTLTMDADLMEVAMQRAAECAVLFSHTRPNGTPCYTAFSPCGGYQGENIAAGYGTAQSVYNGWYNSAGHYANMVKEVYNCIGIGCFVDSNGTRYWVQCFGSATGSGCTATGTRSVTVAVDITEGSTPLYFRGVSGVCTLNVGETQTLTPMWGEGWTNARSYPASDFVWTSSDPSIATVNSSGVVTAVSGGEVTITAKTAAGSGHIEAVFRVYCPITKATASAGITVYDGTARHAPISLTMNGTALTEGTDYTLSGAEQTDAGTYTATVTGAGWFTGSTTVDWTISPCQVTISADNQAKVYGNDDPTLTYTVTGKPEAGAALTNVSLSRKAGEGVGSYTIIASVGENPNYAVAVQQGALTITPRPVTVSADSLTKTYGDADPALTYTANGLISGDTLSGVTAIREAGENAGSYAITLTIDSAKDANYTVTDSGAAASLTILPKAITVTADDRCKAVGEADPALTWTASGLVNGDTLSGVTVSRTETGEELGSYRLAASQAEGSNPNYSISFVDGILSICSFSGDLNGITWSVNRETGVLSISGTGAIPDDSAPWKACAPVITTVVVEEGVTGIGADSFSGMKGLRTVTLPATVTAIGSGAFSGCGALSAVTMPGKVTSVGTGIFSGCGSLTVTGGPTAQKIAAGYGLAFTPDPDSVFPISVTASKTLKPGKSVTLKPKQSGIADPGFTYKSSAKKIAKVDKNGKVTALKTGKATITITSAHGEKAEVKITVKSVKITGLKKSLTLSAGKSLTLKPKQTGTTGAKYTFKSSNKKIVKVSSKGKLTAVKKGTCTITVTSSFGETFKIKVKVK